MKQGEAGTPGAPSAWVTESATALYVGLIALLARSSGLYFILFPELGALGHDIFKRPDGTWARAPLLLIVTPLLTAVVGTLIARDLPYGLPSVLLDVGCSVLAITVLRSPIAPALSAGLLPLILAIHSFWYPPSLLIGTGLLAFVAVLRSWLTVPRAPVARAAQDVLDDEVEEAPRRLNWIPFFLVFLILTYATSDLTGWRFVLFPPLVVIGFEAFVHPAACPWAARPIALMVACGLTAAAGVLCVVLLGTGPVGAMCSILLAVLVLRVLDLHVPPALAAGLLPFVMAHPSFRLPLAVLVGTGIETAAFLAWRRFSRTFAVRAG
jgi:hypothetical protein